MNAITLNIPNPGLYRIRIWDTTLWFQCHDYVVNVVSLPYQIVLPSAVHDYMIKVEGTNTGGPDTSVGARLCYVVSSSASESSARTGYLKAMYQGNRQGFIFAPSYQGGIPDYRYMGEF